VVLRRRWRAILRTWPLGSSRTDVRPQRNVRACGAACWSDVARDGRSGRMTCPGSTISRDEDARSGWPATTPIG